MIRSRFLIATGYWLALVLAVLPLLQPVAGVLPPEPGEVRWRLRALGLLSQALPLPLLGMVVAVGTAALLSHRRLLRGLALLSLLLALASVTAAALLGMDLVQYHQMVAPELRDQYNVVGIFYLVAFGLASILLTWLAAVGWRAARRSRRTTRRRRVRVEG